MRADRRRMPAALAGVISATLLAGVLSGCAGPAPARTTAGATAGTHTAAASPSPSPAATGDPVEAYARQRLANLTLRQKAASLFMLHLPGTDPAALRGYVDRYGVGGMILMGDNIPSTPAELAAQTAAMTASDPGLPPLIAVDEEGGDVTRLGWDDQPGADTLRDQDPAATRAAFARRATLLKQAGISVNFGTVADVTADPNSFIADRVLGTEPGGASARVAASVAGERGTVLSTLKHFPGHGESEADSHHAVPATAVGKDEWSARDAPPFRAGISAGAELVMFGHLAYTQVDAAPASLSAAWHRILTDDLGFRGASITDDLRMLQDTGLPQYQDAGANAVQAIAAGNTMVLDVLPAGSDPDALIDAVVAAVQQGRIPLAQLDAAALKLLELRRSVATEE
ncbi:glycoside hydrolase family 3 N-terminal domain-containing protein [Leifsonia soli]|uniref:Beta-N-acetylhexosaminidase n=1 Tax=Leifsonia soli TaxID=582665 RepID=A0A852SW80_9MICO|nr:glycoside hydrolase family 3 N-terminal domain-containing protein [Leifsonia soli]NYD73366.1 beta-N-acetylhexosaminidase [Leifsonia soli]